MEKKSDEPRAQGDSELTPVADLWRARVGFCGNYFGLSAIGPYSSILFAAKGFSPSAVGLLSAGAPLATLVIVPPVAYICDRFQLNSSVVVVGSVVSTVLLLVILLATDHTVIAVGAMMYFIFSTPVDPLLDQHTMAMLPPHAKSEWGASRVFGAYGWGVGAPLAAQLITMLGWPALAVQYALGRCTTVFCITTGQIHSRPEPTGIKYLEVLAFVLHHRRMMLFLVCACFMGMGYILIATFLFLFLQSLGAPDVLLGISVSTTVLVEIPLFMHSRWLHERFTDRQLFTASMLGWALRVTGYSFLTNPWMVLFLEPFHGFTFGCMWLAGVHYCQVTFPKSLSTSSFGFLHASAFGIGPFLGNILGGQLYEALGPRTMFRVSAGVMLLVMVVYLVLDRWMEQAELAAAAAAAAEAPAGGSFGASNVALAESPRSRDATADLPLH